MENSNDLMFFDDNNRDKTEEHAISPKEQRTSSPDVQRVYLTEIQYYRNPNFVPKYDYDDFFKESGNERYKPLNDDNKTTSPTSNSSKLGSSLESKLNIEFFPLTAEDDPPPLPPKRTKSRSESDLRQRLSDAGIFSDPDVMVNLDVFEEKHNKSSRPLSFESKLSSKSASLQKHLDQALDFSNEFLHLNIDEFEKEASSKQKKSTNPFFPDNSSVTIPHHNSNNPFRVKPNLANLRQLTDDEIFDLENDVTDHTITQPEEETHPRLPPRPPPPKNNRFSCPPTMTTEQKIKHDEEAIFFSNDLFTKAEERNEEAVAFCTSVAEMRKQFQFDEFSTNPGFIAAALVRNNAIENITTDITVYLEPFPEPKVFTVCLSSTADEMISKCLCEFTGTSNDLDVISGQFVLKMIGYTMYLYGNTKLSDSVFIQDCLKHANVIKLSLVRKSHMNVELSRDADDDQEDCRGIYFEHFFTTHNSLSVSEKGLYVLLDTYNAEAARLITDVSRTHEAQYIPDRLIQVVKAISSALAKVELLQIHEAVNLLLELKQSKIVHRTYTLSTKTTRRNYNEYINPEYFDKGRFHSALEKLTSGVYALIELYCKCIHTEFTLIHSKKLKNTPVDVYERIDPRTLTDNFSIRLSSVHRFPANWKFLYEFLQVEVGIYYGGRLLCPLKRSKKAKFVSGFFEHVRFDEYIEFIIPVKKIPREAKFGYVLYGFSAPKKGHDGLHRLGWFTLNLYDYQGFLEAGSRLFGLLSDVEFNPVATCATNYIEEKETPIAKVDFQLYHTEVIFPQPVLLRSNTQDCSKEFSQKELDYIESKIFLKDSEHLTSDEKYFIWENRFAFSKLSTSLKYVLKSAPSWDSEHVLDIHSVLSSWSALSPNDSLEFLQADYPDKKVREMAVLWLCEISNEDLCDYLPELVQALKYEAYHNSALAQFLIRRALSSPQLAHYLFWHLKYYTGDLQFRQRFQIVLSGLLSVCGARLRAQLARQDELIVSLSQVATRIKEERDAVRKVVLQDQMNKVNNKFEACFRLPLDPAIKLSHVLPEESSYFQSNTVPLKVALKNVDPRGKNVNIIFKIGDDLRKDLVTQLMFGLMNKLWLRNGLDLGLMLYKVLPTGPLTGLIEIVPNAVTLREIHVQYGLTGSFKDDSLALWLQRFNSTEQQYHTAVTNFTTSTAGYCVATYLLGIGDRHNDNIMLTKNGHLFHIDFSKFMGENQKFGNISRDRVPFVLTPDMAYVINNGVTATRNFQRFIELCCNAFNIIRRNKNLVLNLLGLMVFSGISYLSDKADLNYVQQALQLHLSDEEATMYFTRLIESSLSSKSTQLNFFIHNLAQMKSTTETLLRSSRSSALFTFSNKVHSMAEDGEITSARVVDFQKRYIPDKHYVFVINITRKHDEAARFVFRRYEDFQELHAKLSYTFNVFSGDVLPELPPKKLIGRSQIREIAVKRRGELDTYLVELWKILSVSKSEITYTFLHSYIKDIEEERRFADFVTLLQEGRQSRVGGRIKISISFKNDKLKLLVEHASDLIPRRLQGLANPYVKIYLLPDPMKQTKRKTKVCRKSLNPTFNETIEYKFSLGVLRKRVLQVMVWDHDTMMGNECLGGFNLYLSTFDLKSKRTEWFDLIDLGI